MMTLVIKSLKTKKVVREVADLPNRGLIIKQLEGELYLTRLSQGAEAMIEILPFDLSLEFYEVREAK